MKSSLLDVWKERNKILQGIKNTVIKKNEVEHISKKRMNICDVCPSKSLDCGKLIKACCSECGCSLEFKTRSLESKCPLNKW